MSTQPKHFLDLDQISQGELRQIIDHAHATKSHDANELLKGKTLALIFEKNSTRTRVSFEVGMRQLGGEVIVLDAASSQMDRGETVEDTARVLSRYVDAIMLRTTDHERLSRMAEAATVPVINGLTNQTHPCQLMADVMTFEEHRGPIKGKRVGWSGDGNNVGASWIQAAERFGFELDMAIPDGLEPPQEVLDWAKAQGANLTIRRSPEEAVKHADAVVTDVWISMGSEKDSGNLHNLLKPYQVTEALMAHAKPEAVFMHCLPAKRGEEVTAEVIDGPQSVVFDEAENRLHAQKSSLAWCLGAI